MYGIVCGFLPFEAKTENDLYYKITEGKFVLPRFLSNDVKDLLSKILKINPNERLSIEEIKNHIWLFKHHTNIIYGIIPSMLPPIDYDILSYIKKISSYPINNYSELIKILPKDVQILFFQRVSMSKSSKTIFDFFFCFICGLC